MACMLITLRLRVHRAQCFNCVLSQQCYCVRVHFLRGKTKMVTRRCMLLLINKLLTWQFRAERSAPLNRFFSLSNKLNGLQIMEDRNSLGQTPLLRAVRILLFVIFVSALNCMRSSRLPIANQGWCSIFSLEMQTLP